MGPSFLLPSYLSSHVPLPLSISTFGLKIPEDKRRENRSFFLSFFLSLPPFSISIHAFPPLLGIVEKRISHRLPFPLINFSQPFLRLLGKIYSNEEARCPSNVIRWIKKVKFAEFIRVFNNYINPDINFHLERFLKSETVRNSSGLRPNSWPKEGTKDNPLYLASSAP